MSKVPNHPPHSDRFSIIICDDDPDDQFLLKAALRSTRLNLDVTSLYNGRELLDALISTKKGITENSLPALIFLDLNMPLVNGFDVLHEIKNNRDLNKVAVYVFSTSSLADDKRKAIALGARDYFVKPADLNELKLIVKSICDAHFSPKTVAG